MTSANEGPPCTQQAAPPPQGQQKPRKAAFLEQGLQSQACLGQLGPQSAQVPSQAPSSHSHGGLSGHQVGELKHQQSPAGRAKLRGNVKNRHSKLESQKQQGDDSNPSSHLSGLRCLSLYLIESCHGFLFVLCCSPASLSLPATTLPFHAVLISAQHSEAICCSTSYVVPSNCCSTLFFPHISI